MPAGKRSESIKPGMWLTASYAACSTSTGQIRLFAARSRTLMVWASAIKCEAYSAGSLPGFALASDSGLGWQRVLCLQIRRVRGRRKNNLLAVLCSSVMHQNRRNQKTAASKPRASFISKKNTCGISWMLSPTDCNMPFPVRYLLGVLGVMMNQHLFGGKGQMRYWPKNKDCIQVGGTGKRAWRLGRVSPHPT